MSKKLLESLLRLHTHTHTHTIQSIYGKEGSLLFKLTSFLYASSKRRCNNLGGGLYG